MEGDGKKSELNCSPKKHYNPGKDIHANLKLDEVVSALSLVCDRTDTIILAAVPKEGKGVSVDAKDEICTLDSFLKISKNPDEFLLHMQYFPEHIAAINQGATQRSILDVHKSTYDPSI